MVERLVGHTLVEIAVGQVDGEVDQHIEGRNGECGAHDHRQVPVEDRLDGEPAQSRPAEDRLDDDGATQQVAQLQAHHGERDKPIAHDVGATPGARSPLAWAVRT